MKVRKIKNGTVIDHITAGNALAVLRILGLSGREGNVLSVLVNVPSRTLQRKDIVKIEGRELSPREVDEIALIAPHATINIVRDYEVAKKDKVQLPRTVKEILRCPNPGCITNTREPVKPTFYVEGQDPASLRCHYCGYMLEMEEVIRQF